MLDLKFIRENKDLVAANAQRRGSAVLVAEIIELDDKRLAVLRLAEELRAQRNKLVGQAGGSRPSKDQVKEGRELKSQIAHTDEELKLLENQVFEKVSWLPNLLDPEVPDGQDEADNVEVKRWGVPAESGFPVRDHQELGELLDVIDLKRAAKVAGSRFYYLKGDGALLAWGLHWWATRFLVDQGYIPFFTPVVAREQSIFGTGYLPFGGDDIYRVENEDFGLIGTSEQTMVGYHAGEVINLEGGPLRYTAFSPCFRKEAGAYGKDTRGIYRVHQFHKVEQIVFCRPEESPKYHEECQENEEHLVQELELPYRRVLACVGDIGAPGYKRYDLEAWFPAQQRYREVTSNTNLTDYQTRRLNIQYRGEKGLAHPHTISATGVTDRLIAAILENNQQEDGSVKVPKVLQPLVGKNLLHAKSID